MARRSCRLCTWHEWPMLLWNEPKAVLCYCSGSAPSRVFQSSEPRSGAEWEPSAAGRRTLQTQRLHSSAKSGHHHSLPKTRRAPQVLALLPAPNSAAAAARLWHLYHQPGKSFSTLLMCVIVLEFFFLAFWWQSEQARGLVLHFLFSSVMTYRREKVWFEAYGMLNNSGINVDNMFIARGINWDFLVHSSSITDKDLKKKKAKSMWIPNDTHMSLLNMAGMWSYNSFSSGKAFH